MVIPHAVRDELLDPRAPDAVRKWAAAPPQWLDVRSAIVREDPDFDGLGAGEAEAITMALELHARLLIDERMGTAVATARGLRTAGTLGVLVAAGERGFVDLAAAVRRLLTETNFRIAKDARAAFLEEHEIQLEN